MSFPLSLATAVYKKCMKSAVENACCGNPLLVAGLKFATYSKCCKIRTSNRFYFVLLNFLFFSMI